MANINARHMPLPLQQQAINILPSATFNLTTLANLFHVSTKGYHRRPKLENSLRKLLSIIRQEGSFQRQM